MEISALVFNLSMLGFVSGSMITLGLGLTIAQIIAPFKNIRIVLRALIANFILVPLFALGIVEWLPVSEGVRTGVILVSLGGGAPFIPMIVATAKGHVGAAVGLMVLLLIVTIIFMPIAAPLMLPGVSVSSWDIAKSLLTIILIPLLLALFIRARFSAIAKRIQPFTAIFTKISVVLLIITVLYVYTKTIIANSSVLPIVFLFFLGAMIIGYFCGGKKSNVRFIFSVGTGLRNPPVAILVASQNFPMQPIATIIPLLIAMVGTLILFSFASIIAKKGAR